MALSRMTEQIGRVLGGRYRLLAPLGAGASAQVYLADDVRLRRRVAVKVLHAALAGDESFLRRFRAEAQAAAALNHPHIVAVYDWSGDDDTPFLVTEFLSGGNLRSMLDGGSRLTPSQALVVGLEAARALDHAHRRGFVHRDIKPANLLFGADARLRIADFGLARAIAEAAWTEPQGAVLGTARYASPEQARGEVVDGRSDVYSLALVLLEAVTGTVPFTADTTIGTLMARLDRPIDVPDELGVLQEPLQGAGRLDPAERLDAAGLGRALVAAAEQLPRPAPLPLVTAEAAVVAVSAVDQRDATLVSPAALPPAGPGAPVPAATGPLPAPTAVLPGGPGSAPPAGPHPNGHGGRPGAGLPTPPGGTSRLDRMSPPPVSPLAAGARPRRRGLLTVLAVVAAVAVGVVGTVLVQRSSVPSHTVPRQLVGAQRSDIARLTGDYGWRIEEQTTRRDGTVPGQILSTDPAGGAQLREGETLTVVVSLGATLVDVPQDVIGMTRDDAEERLTAPGTELVPEFVEEESEDVDEGRVIRFGRDTPARLAKGDTIRVVVSSGEPAARVPDLEGVRFRQAEAALQELGVDVERRVDPDADGRRGEVVDTDPGAGSRVEPGDTVVVVVAGDGHAEVPDLSGDDLDTAREALEDAGLELGDVVGFEDSQVIGSIPRAGTEVDPGTEVVIFTG